MRYRIAAMLIVLTFASRALAQPHESPGERPAAHETAGQLHDGAAEDTTPHPVLPANDYWAPVMLIVIAGMFLAAAIIGPVVRANTPEEVPPAHSHDEPPGTSHHHGHSGTHNVDPADVRETEHGEHHH